MSGNKLQDLPVAAPIQSQEDDAPDTASGTTLCYFPRLEELKPEQIDVGIQGFDGIWV